MIIFNGKELASKLVRKEGRVIEINSNIKDLPVFISKLKKGELSPNDAVINIYKIKGATFTPANEYKGYRTEDSHTSLYDTVYSLDHFQDLEEDFSVYKRNPIAVDFEKYQFNIPCQNEYELIESLPTDDLIKETAIAYGVLPTMIENLPEEAEDIKKVKIISDQATNLTRLYSGPERINAETNPIATEEEALFLASLNPYEKRVVFEGEIHPKKVLDTFIELRSRDGFKQATITPEMIMDLKNGKSVKDTVDKKTLDFTSSHEKLIEAASEVAKAHFKGFVPKVYPGFIEGLCHINQYRSFNENIFNEMADKFERGRIQKIAGAQNSAMFGLSAYIDFTRLTDDTLRALSSNISLSQAKQLIDKGFHVWYENHYDTSISDLLSLIERSHKIDFMKFLDQPASKIIKRVDCEVGYKDCVQMENKYGYKFSDNEIAIKGRHVVAKGDGLVMRMLEADDYTNFIVATPTHCCQHYQGAGESCVWHYTTDPFAACVVIEKNNNIVAQGYVWVDVAKDTLVFDNMEFANDRDIQTFNNIIGSWCAAMPYSNIHVGTGCNYGMNGWGQKVDYVAQMPTTLDKRHVYTDYRDSARAIKKDGQITITYNPLKVEVTPDEPTKWDAFMSPEFAPFLNAYTFSPNERIEKCQAFFENPTPDLQKDFVKFAPEAVATLPNVCPEAQDYLMKSSSSSIKVRAELCKKITNPTPEVIAFILKNDPTYIVHVQNATEEQILAAVSTKPDIINDVPVEKITEKIALAVIEKSPEVFSLLPEAVKELPSVLSATVRNNPKIVVTTPNFTEEYIAQAVSINPYIYSILPEEFKTETVQHALIENNPVMIFLIKDELSYNIAREAVEQDGLAIRTVQKRFPDLIPVALEQTPFAIQAINNPSADQIQYVLSRENSLARLFTEEQLSQIDREGMEAV